MVAWDQIDRGTIVGSRQKGLHHIIVSLGPVRTFAAYAPRIDNVANQEVIFSLVVLHKIKKQLSLTSRSAEMNIGKENISVLHTLCLLNGLFFSLSD